MMVDALLRTIDLAQAGHISVQQVRNYEASGVLPPAERSASGYRLYTRKHLAALKAARSLLAGYGWPRTRAMMQLVHRGDLPAALALIDERHAELARKRIEVEQTLAALSTLAAQSASSPTTHTAHHAQRLRVGEAARQVGMRVSALHFWEQRGLLHPGRDQSSRYRLYDERQMRSLRVVVLLREAGYNFDVIQITLDELAASQPEKAIAAVEQRRAEIARTSWACLGAIPAFQGYVSEFWREYAG